MCIHPVKKLGRIKKVEIEIRLHCIDINDNECSKIVLVINISA